MIRKANIQRYRYLPVTISAITLVIVFFGCSPVPRHQVLTFFFDGVPEPAGKTTDTPIDSLGKPDPASKIGMLTSVAKPKVNYHEPYKEKQCASCHDQTAMGKFLKPQPMLCYQCHDDFSGKYKVVHGPVGGGYCTACHEPHTSVNTKLLKRLSQQMCLYCHNSSLVLKNEVHADIGDANCTDCHNPHGGDDRTMLK
jgi:predicted CXXCH cytochrome family protein